MNIGEKYYCSRCMMELDDEDVCPHCGYDPEQPSGGNFLEEGTLLQNGRYQIGAVIGRGGFGITYAAWDHVLARPAAIKEYFPKDICRRDVCESNNVAVDPDQEKVFLIEKARFSREARVLSMLQDIRNVVAVQDWFEANNTAYIAMEFVRGITLAQYVHEQQIPPQELIKMMRGLIDSLILIHAQGILHRDISPNNIMVQSDGTLKLIDFGAATSEERKMQGLDQTILYNRMFAPPEQRESGKGEQGPWTDVYALSATLYYLICGEYLPESPQKMKNSLKALSRRGIRLKKWQEKAIMDGLIPQADKRIRSMELYRSVLYHLPLPEEIKRRRKFMIRTVTAAAVVSIFSIFATVNFTYGFYLGNGIRYSLRSDGFHAVGYQGKDESLVLPEHRIGIPVVQINAGAFQGSDTLTDVTVPGTVKKIQEFAFNDCENLAAVKLNEGVASLSAQSFGSCGNLQAVSIPDSLTALKKGAFDGSTDHLVLIGSPDSPAAGTAARQGLNFAQISYEENETGITLLGYKTDQPSAVVPDYIDRKPVTEIASGVESIPVFSRNTSLVILPKYLEKIGDFAFYRSYISEISLPETLKSIGKKAFSQSFLSEITVPDSVTDMGESAFSACTLLNSITLSSGMTRIPGGCFEKATSLKQAEIPEGILEVGNLAFSGCQALETLRLPNGARIIEDCAFMDCVLLNRIHLPESLVKIDPSAFNGCSNSLVLSGFDDTFASYFAQKYNYEFYDMYDYDTNIFISEDGNLSIAEDIPENDSTVLPSYFKENPAVTVLDAENLKSRHIVLPERTEKISTKSFYNNTYLESISCPDTLREIGAYAFRGCSRLSDVSFQEGLKKIGPSAFAFCDSLQSIDLPDSVKIIDDGAFENCGSLSSVKIPSSLVLLENDAFSGTGLTAVTIPGNISKCRVSFYGCHQLKDAVIEEGVRVLWGTFAGCENLESVVIPESAEQISSSTFLNCTNLKDVWIYSKDVDLTYVWPAAKHVEYQDISDGEVKSTEMFLENDPEKYLFSDSPDVTIHGYRGSSAQVYAMEKGLNFEIIEDAGKHNSESEPSPSYTLSTRLYTDEELIRMITPVEGDVSSHYWSQFQYAYGYGFTDLAYACLDAYDTVAEDYDHSAHAAKLFLEQAPALGCTTGALIVYFEDFSDHPSLKAGDIITAVDGKKIRNIDDKKMIQNENEDGPWQFTVLRADKNDLLEEITVSVTKEEPLAAMWDLSPKTFENLE